MHEYDAYEQAYKNGYENGYNDGNGAANTVAEEYEKLSKDASDEATKYANDARIALRELGHLERENSIMALDIFTKNYCRVKTTDELVFRCKKCMFSSDNGVCLLKKQAHILKYGDADKYTGFGSMSR